MKHINVLRELSKFAAGLVAADFLVGIWLYSSNLLPINFFGWTVTPEIAMPWMFFDAILLIILIHYGWHATIPSPSIHQRTLLYTIGSILSIVAVLHLLRLVFGIEVNIAGWQAPMWLSWIGTVVAGYLGYASIRFASHK